VSVADVGEDEEATEGEAAADAVIGTTKRASLSSALKIYLVEN
jgi:hypothetical protein